MTLNPYSPSISADASGPVAADPQNASIWMRNLKCMAFLTAGYSILCAALAFSRIAIPELAGMAQSFLIDFASAQKMSIGKSAVSFKIADAGRLILR